MSCQKFSTPISSIAFLPGKNCNALVVAVSYGFDRGALHRKKKTGPGGTEEEEGEEENGVGGVGGDLRKQGWGRNGVYVKFLTDAQIKPKDTATVSSQRHYR